jgi:hypothetical protein
MTFRTNPVIDPLLDVLASLRKEGFNTDFRVEPELP